MTAEPNPAGQDLERGTEATVLRFPARHGPATPTDETGGEDLADDAERELAETGWYGGPVDADPAIPTTLYATIVDRGRELREPIIPAWLRNGDQRAAFVRETFRFVGYALGKYTTRSPWYLAQAMVYAPWGLLRLIGRQIRWWWVLEQHSIRQHAASKNDADTWLKLHNEARRTRGGRGLWLLAELIGVAVAVVLLLLLAPVIYQLLVAVVVVPILARYGRPEGRPIIDRVYSGPKFTRLHAEMVRAAMCSIGIAGIKEPGSVSFPPPGIHRDGPGWLARVNLPLGVEATDVLERRGKLSSALRLPVDQVWPSAGPDHAGQVDLWVGYLPASKMGQPEWSLLADNARTSVFEAHEFGTDQRQRPVATQLFARNFLIGGVPGSGKSYGARTLASIALLDPTCELMIAEFKGTADFGDMAHLCSTYVCGIDDRSLEEGRDIIDWGLAEAERRGERIRKARERGLAPEGKVTPELAAMKGSGLHPIVIIIDEAHELFLHDKAIAQAAERLIKRGRALGIIIILATQIPDSKSVPPNITRCVTVRWCMAVQDHIANDMILGTGAYKRGLSATAYRPGDDAGWGIAIGLAVAGPVKGHFPRPDQTRRLIDRATHLRGGVVSSANEAPRYRRDLLDDVREVFRHTGMKRLHRQQLLDYLVEWWPEVYGTWTVDTLGEQMRKAGVPTVDVKIDGINQKGIKIEMLEAAINAREIESGVAPKR